MLSWTWIQLVLGTWYENQPLEVLDHRINTRIRFKHSIRGTVLRKPSRGASVMTAVAEELLEAAQS